jgi:hypothetical protein
MEHHVAEQVLPALFNASGKMNDTLWLILNKCPKEEFDAYRRGTGKAMGYLYVDIIRPILREHPDLEPEELKGPYEAGNPVQPDDPGIPMERPIAEQALAAFKDASLEVRNTLSLIQKECPEEELVAYRTAVDEAMGFLFTEVIEPILRQHPDLQGSRLP